MVNDNKNMNSQGLDDLDLDVSDEIVVRDKDGSFKVLIGGKIKSFGGEKVKTSEPITTAKQTASPEEFFKEEGLVPKEPLKGRLAPPPPAPWQKTKGAAFYFDAEDEEEVQALAASKGLLGAQDVSKHIEKILVKAGLSTSNNEELKKVRKILESYLKQVRDQIGTREILMRSKVEGGAELDEVVVDNLLTIASAVLKELESGVETVTQDSELDKLIKQSDDIYDFKESPSEEESAVKEHEDILAEEIVASRPELAKEPQFGEVTQPLEQIKPQPPTPPAPQIVRPTITDSNRPKMQDVVPAVKLQGPVEELRFMGLAELRRIGTNSLDNIASIKTKIDALEEESFTKKVEGIKAWRQSPLYNLYVQVGRASMEQGKSVSQIITAKQQTEKETLTVLEFEKITDLNKELRY